MSDAGDYLTHAWALVPHVCRTCFARVLSRQDDAGVAIYRCSNCGIERAGAAPSVVCACGLNGAHCVRNENPSPMWPGEIVAEPTA